MKEDKEKEREAPEQGVADVNLPEAKGNEPETGANGGKEIPEEAEALSLEEVLSRFDGRHNFKPQKPPYFSLAGLFLSIAGWLLLFFLPKRESEDFADLYTQITIVCIVSIVAFALGLLGRKRAPGISFFVYLIAGALFVFVGVSFIVLSTLD